MKTKHHKGPFLGYVYYANKKKLFCQILIILYDTDDYVK